MRKLTQGNEAVFRGAVAAGADYFAGYPISPSTEILYWVGRLLSGAKDAM